MASTEHLRAHHSLRSQQKREAVLSAARAMISSGLQIERAPLARSAGVSEKFIHDKKHADVKGQVREMIAVQSGRQAEREVAAGQAAIASLRAELLNLRAQLGRKDAQIAVLERKLSRQAGQRLEAELPRAPPTRSRSRSGSSPARSEAPPRASAQSARCGGRAGAPLRPSARHPVKRRTDVQHVQLMPRRQPLEDRGAARPLG